MHWTFGLIGEDEFRARALYGMYVVLLGIATDTVRQQIADQLHGLEQRLGQFRKKKQSEDDRSRTAATHQ